MGPSLHELTARRTFNVNHLLYKYGFLKLKMLARAKPMTECSIWQKLVLQKKALLVLKYKVHYSLRVTLTILIDGLKDNMPDPIRNNRSLGRRLMWLGLYFGLGLGVSLLFPFPISILAYFIVIIIIDSIRARHIMKKMGISGIRGLIGKFSGAGSATSHRVKYYCMNCGYEHREISCPKCGSKMKRVG